MTTREYAKNLFSKWNDDDWLNQPIFDKLFWECLNGQRGVNAAGIFAINFTRWRKAMRDGETLASEQQLRDALARMEARGYVFLDEDTGEGLIRSRIRNDGLEKQPTMFLSALRLLAVIDSPKFAFVMLGELDRMECPEVKGTTDQAKVIQAALIKAHPAAIAHLTALAEGYAVPNPIPSAIPNPIGDPIPSPRPGETVPNPIPNPIGDPIPSVSGSVSVSPPPPTDGYVEEEAHASDQPAANPPPPRFCHAHMPGGTLDKCGDCKAQRIIFDRWLSKQNIDTIRADQERGRAQLAALQAQRDAELTARAQAIANCPLSCDEDGYHNGRVCDHTDRTDTVARGRAAVQAALKHQPQTPQLQNVPNDDEPPY